MLEEARKRGLTVDLTDGSGWPPGGSFLDPQDGFLTLQSATQTIKGGQSMTVALPTIPSKTGVPPRLVSVLAARIVATRPGENPNTVSLENTSPLVLTAQVRNDTLRCQLPAGDWKLIALWSRPSGQQTMTSAPRQGPVVDHFDSLKVIKNYTHVLGPRTGLEPYYGNPLRAIFNDSYEFEVDRHFSPDLIAYFKKKREYDLPPWLPANLQKGYNYASFKRPNSALEFSFGPEDWRLRHDYDQTIGELLGEHFIKTSSRYLENRGMLHRTQAYGMHMDMMANAGLASIPETESMLGPEAILKVMTSGAHLYNAPSCRRSRWCLSIERTRPRPRKSGWRSINCLLRALIRSFTTAFRTGTHEGFRPRRLVSVFIALPRHSQLFVQSRRRKHVLELPEGYQRLRRPDAVRVAVGETAYRCPDLFPLHQRRRYA